MIEKVKRIYANATLATKIRYSYIVLLMPIVIFLVFCFFNLWNGNQKYEAMINSTVVASEFSLDFKKDFDYETYLLVVSNKTPEESNLRGMLGEANRIVMNLEKYTDSKDNLQRLESVKKYLGNLEIYVGRIEENLLEGNKYEDNLEIWENDVQIVTTLVSESIFHYIYYEVKGIQASRNEYQNFFMTMIRCCVIAFVGILGLILFLSYMIPLSITHPISELSHVTDQVARGDLSVRANINTGIEAITLSHSLNAMIDEINGLLEQVKTEQIRLRRAEFELLQSQINPHFLYNTLDTIVWLAEVGDQEKVVQMVGNLSDFFRTSLSQGKDIVTVERELQHVRSYLEIQQVRYQDILTYELNVPETVYSYMIPKITLQPLVENALYHGIKNKRGLGKIVISGRTDGKELILQVKDNGIGIDEERLHKVKASIKNKTAEEGGIYGLYNVNERIGLHFGEAYGIHIESTFGEGTVVQVTLPCVEVLSAVKNQLSV